MKTKILSILLLSLIANLAFSQNARAILDKAASAYTSGGAVTAKFTLNTKDIKAKQVYSQDGTAHMQGNKFQIEVPDAITWFDGKTQWVYIKDTDEVNISNPTGEELQGISPSTLFSIYKQGFDLKYKGEKTVGGKAVQEVEMIAQKKNSPLKKVLVEINKVNNTFSKIVLYDNNGMENTLIINNYKKNNALNNSSFTFNQKNYPKAEIIDLR